jgi:hypothetical protein
MASTSADNLPGMRASIKRRAAAIRDNLRKAEPGIGPGSRFRYSVAVAEWEAVRLLIDRGDATRADHKRFAQLSKTRAVTRPSCRRR